jgi:hypothetical protein
MRHAAAGHRCPKHIPVKALRWQAPPGMPGNLQSVEKIHQLCLPRHGSWGMFAQPLIVSCAAHACKAFAAAVLGSDAAPANPGFGAASPEEHRRPCRSSRRLGGCWRRARAIHSIRSSQGECR